MIVKVKVKSEFLNDRNYFFSPLFLAMPLLDFIVVIGKNKEENQNLLSKFGSN